MEYLPQIDPRDEKNSVEISFDSGKIRAVHWAVTTWLQGRDAEDMTPHEREISEIYQLNLIQNRPEGASIEFTSVESINVLAGVVCDYAQQIGAEPIRRKTLVYAEAEDLAVELMFVAVPVKSPAE